MVSALQEIKHLFWAHGNFKRSLSVVISQGLPVLQKSQHLAMLSDVSRQKETCLDGSINEVAIFNPPFTYDLVFIWIFVLYLLFLI